MSTNLTERDKDFMRGFACAIGALIRDFNDYGTAVKIMKANGISVADVAASNVSKFDSDPIMKAWGKYNPVGSESCSCDPKDNRVEDVRLCGWQLDPNCPIHGRNSSSR